MLCSQFDVYVNDAAAYISDSTEIFADDMKCYYY
jgi:hypothetical protein